MGYTDSFDWAAIEPVSVWPVLLTGNGAGRAVASAFDYSSLLDVAHVPAIDRDLFDEA
jgi:hypothetical protein